VATVTLFGAAACGGDDSDDGASEATGDNQTATTEVDPTNDDGDAGGNGEVVDAPPPGEATASVDGLDFSFDQPGGIGCDITDDSVTFSFRIGDNEVTLGGGANRYDEGWLGAIELVVANPDGEDGPVAYFPDLQANGDGLVVDGTSMSYTGPMQKQPPNDGTNPAPEDVGEGSISATCP
jgi:hypothetical protein